MAVGISRSIGIGMKKCCGGGTITPPPPSPFPLRFINTANVPAPSGCDTFEASITITRNGSTFLASEMTKSSNSAAVTTVDPISVYATDIIEVFMEAFPITDPACSSTNTTELSMDVGNPLNGSTTVKTVTSNDSPPTALYQFYPVQNSLDMVNIDANATNVTSPPSTFTLSIYEDYYNPSAPPDCDAWQAQIEVNGVTQCTITKTSNNAAIISNPTLTITTGDFVEVILTADAISNVQCNQAGWTGTDVALMTGSLATSITPKLTVQSTNNQSATATYVFNPPAEANVHDFITIAGSPF